jgi:hypothetical protein
VLAGAIAAMLATPAPATLTFDVTDYPIAAAPPSRIGEGEDQPIALVDLNMDGKLDVVIADSLLGVVYVFLNQGAGTFAPGDGSPFTACSTAENILGGQFNAATDQKPDVIVGCASGIVRLLGDGAGHLGAPEPFLSGIVGPPIRLAHLSGLAGGDLLYGDGFGAACFFPVSALGDGTTTEVCSGGPLNTVTPAHFYDGPCASDEIVGFAIPSPPVYELEVLALGNSCGAPFASSDRQSGVVGPTVAPLSMTAADLDHDGDSDVVMGDSGGIIHVQPWTVNGIPMDQQPTNVTSVGRVTSVAVADFDGDGNADIAATEDQPAGGSNLFVVHLGHGSTSQFDGPLTFPVVGDLQTYTDTPQMAVGDVDGDGKADVVVVAGYAGSMSVLLSRGAGGTTTTTTTTLVCNSITTCLAALTTALPSPAGAASKKLKHVAVKVGARYRMVAKTLAHAAAKTGKKQSALYTKAKNQLEGLETLATKAAAKGTLGVPLPPLEAAVAALLAQIP